VGVVAGAAGSIASQIAGNALGVQNGFDWKGVALGALGGGISAGLANTALLGGGSNTWQMTAARMATANALTQGVAVVTGLQSSFDWRGVAASAVGGGVGAAVGSVLDNANVFGSLSPASTAFARAGVTSFAAGTAAAIARGGKVAIQQVAVDAFGNALGSAFVSAAQHSGVQEDMLAAAMHDNSVRLIDGTTISEAENLRRIQAGGIQLTAGQEYTGGLPNGSGWMDAKGVYHVEIVGTDDQWRPDATGLGGTVVGRRTEADILTEQFIGGTQGVMQSAIDAVDGTATIVRNSILQVGDLLTFGMNHSHPVMQQAWAEQSALGQGIVNLITAPRQTAATGIQHVSDRYEQAAMLRAQGDEIGAARITANVTSNIAAGGLGGVQGIRGAAQWGAASLRTAGVADARLVLESVPSMSRQAGGIGVRLEPLAGDSIGNTDALGADALSDAAARRAYLNDKFGRTGDLDLDINIRGRQEVATNFFRSQGIADDSISSYLTGYDFTQPVEVRSVGAGKTLWQYQTAGAPQGNWYTFDPGTLPTELGINPSGFNRATQTVEPKLLNMYTTTDSFDVLWGKSAAVNDFWSVKGQPFMTTGGGTQMFTNNKSSVVFVPN